MAIKKYDEDLENIFNGKYNYSKYELEQKEERQKSLNELEQERNSRNSLLKMSQNKLQEDLNKKNINGRVFGKHIEAESAPSRNELKVGKKFAESENDNTSSLKTRPYDKNALLKDVESVKKVRQYGNNEEEQSLIKDVKKKWSDRAYAISNYETAKAIQDEENMNPVSRLGYSLYSGGKSLFKSFVRGDLQTEDGITLDSYNDAINSKIGERSKVYQISSELGKEVAKYGLNAILPGLNLGTALYTTDIAQRTYNDAKKEGYSDNSARLYGLLVGGMDYALNKIGTDVSTQFAKGGASLDAKQTILENLVDKGLKKVIKNKAMENIATSFVSNGLEEWSQEYIQDFLKYYSLDVLDKGASANPLDFIKSEKESDVNQRAIESFIVGGFVGGIGGGFGELNLTKQQRNTQQAIYDYERQTGHELSNANQNTIAMIAKTYQENVKRTPNSKEILDTFKNIRQSQIDTFQKPALEMFTDLDEKHRTEYNNLVNDVSQIIYDTGINVKFDPNQQTVINSENGTIILNPTLTDMPIKNVLLHEISKQTVDNDTKNYILNKLKKDGVYETYKNELLATGEFDELNVDSEIVAQELDAIFQNENEIKELAEKDKGLFNNIKDTFNTLTGKLTNNRNTRDALYFREVNDRINSLYGEGDLNDLSKITGKSINNTNNVENVSKNASNIRYKTKEAESKGKSLEKILNRSGITNYEFTNNDILEKQGRTVKNRVIDAYYENGKIMINLDSKNAINKIIGHELTHSLENSSFMQEYRDTIYDYAKTIGKYNEIENRVKDLYKNVKNADIDNELTAELTSEFLFNDKEFINDLAGNHTSLFKKIYNFIKTLFAKLKGSEAEDKLSKAMELYKNAYNQIANTGNIKTGNAEYLIGYIPNADSSAVNVEIDENGMAVVNDQPENEFVNIDTNFPTGKDAFTKSLSENKDKSDYGKSNTGNDLSNDVLDFFKNTKAVDYFGRLMELYHTNKYIADPFRVFDPAKATSETGEHYQYEDDDTIIFLTPSYLMSASYGRGETPGLNTVYRYWHNPEVYLNNLNNFKDVEKFINDTNSFLPDKTLSVKQNKDGSYTVTQERSELLNTAKDISKNYSMSDATSALINKVAEERFENFDEYKMDTDKIYDNTLLDETRKRMKEEFDKIENKTTANENIYNRLLDTLNEIEKYYKNYDNHDKFQFMQFLLFPSRYSDTFETKTFNYKNEKELSKEIKWDLGDFNKKDTYIYPVYANITKPFVYDFEQTWWANGENLFKIPKTKADRILNEFTKDDAEIKEIKKQITNARERSKYLREKYEKQNLNILYNDLVTADQITTGILEKYFGDSNGIVKTSEIKRNYLDMSEKEFDEYLKEEHPKLWYEFNNEVTTNELLDIINDYGISNEYRDDYLKNREIFTYRDILDLYKELSDAYSFNENDYYRYFEKEILNNVLPKLQERTKIKDLSDWYQKNYLSTYDTQDRITEKLWEYSNPINDYAKSFIENDFGKLETNDIVRYVKELVKNGADYDGVILKNVKDYGGQDSPEDYHPYNDLFVAFNSNQVKSVSNDSPTDSPNIDYSLSNKNDTFETTGNFNLFGNEIELLPNEEAEIKEKNKKILSPTEIANLKPEDANMTPELQKKKYNKKGDGESKQVETLLKSNLFTDEQKQRIIADEEFRKYDKITNKESLDKAFEKLKNGGKTETLRWFNNKENADAIDMAEGAILMKMYADNGMNDQMVEVAKKFRDMKTKTGQALQASSILSRMTPEGMVAYAQSELTEAYNELVKTKSKEWVEENKEKFDLTTSDVDFIMDTMEKVSKMEDGYDKKVELAKIQKLMTDKIPPTISKSIKGFMRISMLFNPKTQVRNVLGNTLIAPVNLVGDIASSVADKAIAKKTGVRTTGTADIKSMLKGFKKGAYEATNDFKLGINTKDMNGNRFEIGEGKSFSDKYAIGRGLNKVEHLLNYTMDVGDRVFYESWFENSLANQMALNKVNTPTQEMIDIATTEALQRTWNDNNKYTKFVLDVRKGINSVLGGEDYGLGDVLIPFAKTPANLTKAIVDYSPVGMVNALVQGNNLKKAISRGDMTPQQQHKFVQTLGKATAGTMLYILGYALAKTGVLSGKDDEDKDTKNFMKNVLGINQYSVKIGNTSFTYDWAQPISAPFAMMTNLVNSRNKETALLESVVASLDTAGSILLEQSFLQSINEVLTDNNGVVSGLLNAVLDLPARAIPTLFKQVADLADPVQRQTFEYGKPLQTAGEKMLVKIPGASKLLAPKVNTMGEDILKYGGKNNVFNVMFNPANVNKENVNEVGQEIYNVYKSTGKKDVMPRVAPYSINKKNGEKVQLSSSQIAEFQKMEGKEIENNIKDIMKNSNYKNLSNEKKAELIKNIVNYSYNLTENKMFGIELSSSYKTVENVKEKGGDIGEYYLYKTQLGEKDSEYTKRKKLRLTNISKKTKSAIYEASVDNDNEKNTYNLYNVLKENNIDINEYLDYLSIEFKGDKDEDGQTISGSKKNKIIDYLNSSNLTYKQKLLIGGKQFTLDDEEQEYIIDLILKSKLSKSDKEKLIGSYKGIKIYSDGTARW